MTSVDSDADFRSLVDELDGIAIWTASSPDEFDYISAGFEGIWGISVEAVYTDTSRLIDGVHPDDRDAVRTLMGRSDADVSEGTLEHRVVRPDGTVRWVSVRLIPLYDGEGSVRQVVGVTTDITDLKRRAEKLAILNRVVRHDVRNDMAIVVGWMQLLRDHVDDEGLAYLRKTLSAGEHILELTESARAYVELVVEDDEIPRKPVPLKSMLETEIELRTEAFPHADIAIDGVIPDVELQANEMVSSVFRNLLNNAVQHNDSPDTTVTVAAERDGGNVRIRVADNGPGIDDDRKESIFGKDQRGLDSSGTGIGLYLVQSLVDEFGGDVWVADNDPRGAVFTVTLPIAAEVG